MIKVNVIVGNKNWIKFIRKPEAYLKRKINLLNKNLEIKTKQQMSYHFRFMKKMKLKIY